MSAETDALEAAVGELRAAGLDGGEVAGYRRVLAEATRRGWPESYLAEMVRFKLLLRERRGEL